MPKANSGLCPSAAHILTCCLAGVKSKKSLPVILSKLLWYRAAPMPGRQFQDALEVNDIQDSSLEHDYLERWASALDVDDLLKRVKQAAIHPPAG
jgi:hypothetical protein